MEEPVVRHQAIDATRAAAERLSLQELRISLRRPRTLFSVLLNTLTATLTFIALVPLFSVIYMLLLKGIQKLELVEMSPAGIAALLSIPLVVIAAVVVSKKFLSDHAAARWALRVLTVVACVALVAWYQKLHLLRLAIFTSLPPAAFEEGGGFGNAIAGTLMMVGLAALLSVPLGILAAVFLAEVGPDTQLAKVVRFGAKVLSGFPSILAGVFAYGAVVLITGGFSAWAGGIALSILMLPTVTLTAEDAIRMVPAKIKEAAIGMGANQSQVICKVVLPTAAPGILTGVMLAVARAAGETAPLLFTALFSNYWPTNNGHIDLKQPTASMAVLIYNFSSMPYENQVQMAWAAALVLVLLVLTTNLIGQSLSQQSVQD
jgi:phosphate transport system permease protein